jgi:substrate-binding family protein
MTRRTIAVTANLDPRSSVHAGTFLRAVRAGIDWTRQRHGVEVEPLWHDDGASPEGAARAARAIAASRPEAVVGHFASGAALAAYPIYQAARIPLFLPAATSSLLSGKPCVYRLCDNDEDYCSWVAGCVRERYRRVQLHSDGSAHGDSVIAALARRLPPERVAGAQDEAQAVFIAGMFRSVLPLVRRFAGAQRTDILLADDCQSPALCGALQGVCGEVSVFGFRAAALLPQAQALCPELGGTGSAYFFETLAAIEVAAQWSAGAGAGRLFDTVLGPVRFGGDGESRPRRFCRYVVTARGFAQAAAESAPA